MTEEQGGGEQIGRLWVEIGGSDKPLEEVIAHAAQSLANFITKEYTAKIGVQYENAGGGRRTLETEIRRTAARAARGSGQAIVGEIEQGIGKVSVKEVKVEKGVKIDKDTLTSAIQGSLNGHPFKISLNQDFIRQQIQEALGGTGFSIGGIAVGGHGAHAAPAQQTGISPEQRAALDAQFYGHRYSGSKGANLGKLIEDWDSQLRVMTGHTGATPQGPTAAFEDMVDQLGDRLDDWADKIEKLDPESLLPDVIRSKFHSTGSIFQEVLKARAGGGSAPSQPPPQVDQAKFIQQAAKVIAQANKDVAEKEPRYDYREATLARARRGAQGALGPTSIDELIKGLVNPSTRGFVGRAAKRAVGDQNVSAETLEMVNQWIESDLRNRRPRTSSTGANRGAPGNRESAVFDKNGNPLFAAQDTPGLNDTEADAAARSQLGNKRENVRSLRGPGTFTTQGFTADLEGLLRTLERGGLRNVLAEQKTGNLHTLEATGSNEEELRQSQLAIDTLRGRQGSKRFSLEGVENQVSFLKPDDVAEIIIRKMFGNATVEGGDTLGDKILADPTFQGKLAQAITQGGTAKPYNVLGGNTQAGNAAPGSTASLTAAYREEAGRGPQTPAERAFSEAINRASNASSRRNIELGVGKSGLERALDLERDPKVIGREIAEQIRAGAVPDPKDLVQRLGEVVANAVPDTANGESQFGARYRAFENEAQKIRQEFGLLDENGGKVKGRAEDTKVTDALIDIAKSTIFTERRITAEEGDRAVDLAEAGRGRGRIAKKAGKRATGRQSKSVHGGAEFEDVFEQPTTSLDIEIQQLAGTEVKERARITAQKAAAQNEALRRTSQKFGVPFKPSTGDSEAEPIDRLAFKDEAQRKAATAFFGRSNAGLQARVAGAADVAGRHAEITAIKAEADAALKEVAGIKFQGPFAKPGGGFTQGQANTGIQGLNDQRAAIAAQQDLGKLQGPFIRDTGLGTEQIVQGHQLGLSDAARKEALEVLDFRTAQARNRPNTRGTRDPLTGAAAAETFAAAAEGRARRPILAGGGGAGGSTTFGGGGNFGFPIPLPVEIVASIPLTILGGRGAARAATDGEAASAADQAEATVAGSIQGSSRLPKRLRYKRTTFEDPYNKAGSPIKFVDKGIGIAPTPITILNKDEVARDRQRAREERRPEIEERALLQRQRRLRSQARVQDPVGYAAEQDTEDFQGKELRAQLRVLGRRIPRRSFGASLTDLLSSIVPGHGSLEKQLEFGDLATREAAEIQRTRTQRAQTRTTINTLGGQIEQARAAGQPQRAEQLTQVLAEQRVAYKNQTAVIEESTKRFKTFYGEATKASTVFKSFGAAAIGGAAAGGLGALQFAAGSIIAQPIMQAIGFALSQGLVPAIDQALGFPGAASQVVGGQAQTVRAAGGRENVALAQLGLQTGNTVGQAGQVVTQRAAIEAGNQALAEQVGLIRAASRIRQEGGPNAALTQSLGGFAGGPLGGIPSIDEIIGKQLQLNPRVTANGSAQLQPTFSRAGAFGQPSSTFNQPRSPEALAALKFNLDALNKIMEKANGGIDKFADAASATADEVKAQADALDSAGFTNIATAVRNRQGILTENGKAVTDANQIAKIFKAVTEVATKPTPADFLETQAPQIKAQQYLNERQRNFNLSQLPIQEGIELGQQPLLPATAGFAKGDAARFKGELAGVQTTFDQVTKEATAARGAAVDFFKSALPGNDQAANDFAAALQKSAQYGQDIAKLQLGAETAQAALAAHQYSFQLFTAKRSLQDALALQGKITSGAQNLGVIERQQFDLQRQAQSLSLGQSQRQINFQRAIAGLTAPGLTGEERAARIEQAKIEADFAQKQLDIQKKLFGLGGRQFKITADRNVQDLTKQIGLLSEGREVTLKTAVAQKQIQALTLLQSRENKKIQTFYQSAVDATSHVMQLEAQLVANTEIDLNKVGNAVLTQFRKVYGGLLRELGLGGNTSTGRNPRQYQTPTASGGLFKTTGAVNFGDRVVGEAGSETVAVLRNPRPFASSGGGGGTTVVIDLRGAQVSDEEQMKRLVTQVQSAVERGLARKGNILGLR